MTQEDPMTTLLEKATPRPWVVQVPGDNDPGAGTVFIDTHAYPDGPEPVVAASYPLGLADAELIVRAVNAYEPLVKALREIAERTELRTQTEDCGCNEIARAALATVESPEREGGE